MTAGAGGDGRDSTPAAHVLSRTVELAGIPAPTGAEQGRASVVRRWWDDDGWAPFVDPAGNVWGQVAGRPGARAARGRSPRHRVPRGPAA